MIKYFISEEYSGIPCNICGMPVQEFSIPSDIWNKVVRDNGKENNNEYICIWCFFDKLREKLKDLDFYVTYFGRDYQKIMDNYKNSLQNN